MILLLNSSNFSFPIAVAGGNKSGFELSQLSGPWVLCVNEDQIYIADCANHRIVAWKCGARRGQVVAGGSKSGREDDLLYCPSDVIVHKETNSLIICDRKNSRVVQWPCQNGTVGKTIIANIVCTGLATDKDGFLYISNTYRHEVTCWRIGEDTGTLVAGGNKKGSDSNQLKALLNTSSSMTIIQFTYRSGGTIV